MQKESGVIEEGKYIAAPINDMKTVVVWEVSTGREVVRIKNLNGKVAEPVVLNPSGRFLALVTEDAVTRVFDVASGQEISSIKDEIAVSKMLFSPGENNVYLATSGLSFQTIGRPIDEVKVWEIATKHELVEVRDNGHLNKMAFSPDGEHLAIGVSDSTARVIEIYTGVEIMRMNHEGSVNDLAFSPDGDYLATGSDDDTARVWDVQSGRETARVIHKDRVTGVAFSPDGNYLATSSEDKTARVWKLNKDWGFGAVTSKVKDTDVVHLSPDGKYLASASMGPAGKRTLLVRNTADGSVVMQVENTNVGLIAFSSNGKYIGIFGEDVSGTRDIQWWELPGGQPVLLNTQIKDVAIIDVSPDGKYLVAADDTVTNENETQLLILERSTGHRIGVLKENDRMLQQLLSAHSPYLFFSPDSHYFITRHNNAEKHYVQVFETTTGREVIKLNHDGEIGFAAFSPDGHHLVIGGNEGRANYKLFEVPSWREKDIEGPLFIESDVYFSQSGKYAAVAADDKRVYVYDVAHGQLVMSLIHESMVVGIAFSHNEKYLAAASLDGIVRIWDILAGREVARTTIKPIDEIPSGGLGLAFSQDDKIIIITGDTSSQFQQDKTAQAWLWDANDLITKGCALLSNDFEPGFWRDYTEWHKATFEAPPSKSCVGGQ
jgi:WD40 repeat protein